MASPTPSPISDQAAGEHDSVTHNGKDIMQIWFECNRDVFTFYDRITAPTTGSAPSRPSFEDELIELCAIDAPASPASSAPTREKMERDFYKRGFNAGREQGWTEAPGSPVLEIARTAIDAAPPANAPVASVLTDAARAIDNLKFIAKTLDASGDLNASSRIMNAVEALAASMGGDRHE